MEVQKFNNWLNYRINKIDEGFFDNLFKSKEPEKQQSFNPDDPAEIDKQIYSNPIVIKYTNEVLKHMGIQSGAKLQKIDTHNMPIPRSSFIVSDWTTQDPNFYKALQRFIAGHILGQGSSKSFLRISHHDAAIIINTLDKYSWADRNSNHGSIADELQINNPNSLSIWMQPKVPVAPDAILQQGFERGSDDFAGNRVVRTGRGNPLAINYVKKLVDAGTNVVQQKLTKIPEKAGRNYIGAGLWSALGDLQKALENIPNVKPIVPVTPSTTTNTSGRRVGTGTPKP